MVVGYGGKKVILENDDLSYYGRILVRALVKELPDNYYILYTPFNLEKTNKKLMTVLNDESVRVKFPRSHIHNKEGWYKGKGVMESAKGHGVNVFHGIDGRLPSGIKGSSIPGILTLADPMFNECGGGLKRWLMKRSAHQASKVAKRIVTLSQVARQQVIDNYDVNPDNVEVVYPCFHESCDESVPENMYDILRQKYHLPERFILYKGRMEEEDDIADALRVLRGLEDRHISIVMLGYRTDYFDKTIKDMAHDLHLFHRFKQVDKVHHTDLTAIVKMAEAVVLPRTAWMRDRCKLINAQRTDAIVVCRDSAEAREYGGDGAIYYNTPEEGATQLEDLLNNDAARQQFLERARENSERFTSKVLADNMMHIYRSVLMHRRLYK